MQGQESGHEKCCYFGAYRGAHKFCPRPPVFARLKVSSLCMRQVIPPNPENDSLANIELTIRATADRDMANRLAVVRLAIKGHSEEQIADIAMVSTRSVRRYIQLFNEGGIDSLASASRSGRPPLVSEIEEEIILYNLDHPEFVGESHWTLLKLQRTAQTGLGPSDWLFHTNSPDTQCGLSASCATTRIARA